jgi:hypothetical protein
VSRHQGEQNDDESGYAARPRRRSPAASEGGTAREGSHHRVMQ